MNGFSNPRSRERHPHARQVPAGPFTLETLTSLYRDGYTVFDPGFPPELLDAVAIDSQQHFHYSSPTQMLQYSVERRIADLYRESSNVAELARLGVPWVKSAFPFTTRTPFCFQTLNFLVGTGQAVHSDAIHFDSIPSGWMCGIWVALEDIVADSGPLLVYPGSHTLPHLTKFDFAAETYQQYESRLAQLIKDWPSKLLLLKRGQAVLWLANLLHGGSPPKDPHRSRMSQVSHYFFSGCRYFTSVGKDPDQEILWRDATAV